MKTSTNTEKGRVKKEIYYASQEELLRVKRERMQETFSKVDPEQLRKFINREI